MSPNADIATTRAVTSPRAPDATPKCLADNQSASGSGANEGDVHDGKDSKLLFSSADPTVGLVMTRSPPSDVARRDRAPLAAMGFFSFTRSKSSASAAAKKASSPQDSWLHEAVIRFLQVRATFRAFSRHHVRSDTQRRDGTLSSNGGTTRLASRPLPDFRRVLLLAQGPMYTHPLMSFIDHHCAVFDDEDENKLEYTSIHAEFKRLVETLLSEFLVEVGVPPARFVQVVADSAGGELNDFVLGSILTVDDFVQFKAMMVRRNVQLTEEVLELHRARADAQAAAAAAAADASSSPAPSTPDPATEHPPTSPLDRSVDDDGFHRGALAQAEASSAASAADLDALATNLERDARRAAEISAREAALARAVPEFEDDTTAPEPDDGFDEGALEQAMKLSEAQFEADAIAKRDRATRRAEEASAAATKAAATAEAARAMADAAAATERAVLAQARADPNYDAGLLLRARAESAEAAAKAAEAAAKAAEAAESTGTRGVEGGASNGEYHDELRRAMEESAADAAREAEEADRERRELEEAMAASLALAESSRESSGASGSGNPPSVTSSPATKHAAGLVDRLGKAPLGSLRGAAAATTGLPPVAGALRPLQKIAPATNVAAGKGSGALRGAGYKPPGVHAGSGVDAGVAAVVPGSDFRAVREAAAAAAASQKAIVAEKKARKDAPSDAPSDAAAAALAAAAAAASLRGMDAVRREQYVAEQRQLLLARKAAERERELAEFAANGQSHFVNPLYAESGRASPEAEVEGDADAPGTAAERSDEEQRAKREALRAELAKQMKAELARRNDWTVEEVA